MQYRLTAPETLPEFQPGDDLEKTLVEACECEKIDWPERSIVVISQKVVSKVEGGLVDLRSVRPSPFAESFAAEHGKDPRLVELVLKQSRRIVKMDQGVLIAETHRGFVCANAGVDRSNVAHPGYAVVLPDNPDASARAIRKRLSELTGVRLGVIISDTFGRPWRLGQVDVAIGAAGIEPLSDQRGGVDRNGRPLTATRIAVADQISAAAGLLMAKDAGRPAVIVDGLSVSWGEGSARELLRDLGEDLFR